MALFGKKATTGPSAPPPGGSAGTPGAPGSPPGGAPTGPPGTPPGPEGGGFSPEKASRFFDRARTIHDTGSFEYAMTLWLDGLRYDPTSMAGVEGFFRSSASFLTNSGGKGPSKDTLKQYGGKGNVERYLAALLAWGVAPQSGAEAVRATQAAAALNIGPIAVWLGERAMSAAARDKKPRKDHFVALMEILSQHGAYERAVTAGEQACRIDPTDAKLAALVRNMSAQATMSRGGYENAGQEGGFRSNIRDSDTQRRLEEESKIVRTGETLDRLAAAARAEYEANPADRPAVVKYLKLLDERNTPADQETAHAVAMRMFEGTREYRFRQLAGDIRLKQGKRRVGKLQAAAGAAGASDADRAALDAAKAEFAALEITEYQARVAAYPTDLTMKYELGRRLFEAGRYEEAIGLFQDAKSDAKNRGKVLQHLGLSFQRIGWHDEAVETFRNALEAITQGGFTSDPELQMELRYGLMLSLQARAAEMLDPASADEAYKLASSIAIQQINFKDVRVRREELKGLILRLKGGGGAA